MAVLSFVLTVSISSTIPREFAQKLVTKKVKSLAEMTTFIYSETQPSAIPFKILWDHSHTRKKKILFFSKNLDNY